MRGRGGADAAANRHSHNAPMNATASFGWCLVGPGRIAHRFAEAVQGLPGMRLAVVHGRDPARAQAFAARWTRDGAAPAVTDQLDEALSRPDVQGVYVATPHAFHGPAVRAALMAGKAVLCEKPMVASVAEALPLAELARRRGVFLMEAVWTRFLPLYRTVGEWLREGAIGPLRGLQSSFCFRTDYEAGSRLYDPALAGGSLLDIGIYNLTMTRWALQQSLGGRCPEPVALHATGRLAPTGVDQRVWAMLDFGDGLVSQFTCGFDGPADNGLRIAGERGHIVVPRTFWEATEAELHVGGEAPLVVRAPLAINGFEGEIDEVVRRVRAGETESPVMPLQETIATLGWMDRLRAELGVRYPFE